MFSVSQVNDFDLCQRKWAGRSIERIKGPPSPSAALGSGVHKEIERFLRKEVIGLDLRTREGEIALAGAHHWPDRETLRPEWIEKHFTVDLHGFPFQGYIDIWIPGSVTDHKTCSSFNWAKTPTELTRNDPQSAIYSLWDQTQTLQDFTELRWIYYRTRAPYKSILQAATITRKDMDPTLDRVAKSAERMTEIKNKGLRMLDLPPSPAACMAYGGCPYLTICNLTPNEQIEAFMSDPNYLAQLAAQVNGSAPQTAAAPAQAAPALPPGWSLLTNGTEQKYNPPGVPAPPGWWDVANPPPPPAPPPPPVPAQEEAPKAKRGRPTKAEAAARAQGQAAAPDTVQGLDGIGCMAEGIRLFADGLERFLRGD